MRLPLISVILPYLDAADTLERAIKSILDQRLEDFELILIDNGSADGSTAIAQDFVGDSRVLLLSEQKRGVVFASQKGLTRSRASFVARMDADDVASPDRLATQMGYLQNHKDTTVVGSRVVYEGAAANEGFRQYVDWSNSVLSPREIAIKRFVEMPLVNPTLMFRRSVIAKLGWYLDGPFPEDYELVLRYLEHGVSIAKVPESLLSWHDSANRLTRTDPRYSTEAFYTLKTRYLAKWLAKHNPFHPDVWIWGAGKLSRRRSALLQDHGIIIKGYIDVKARQLTPQCIPFEQLPPAGGRFVLSYVSNRGKGAEISEFLLSRGYREGRDFLMAA